MITSNNNKKVRGYFSQHRAVRNITQIEKILDKNEFIVSNIHEMSCDTFIKRLKIYENGNKREYPHSNKNQIFGHIFMFLLPESIGELKKLKIAKNIGVKLIGEEKSLKWFAVLHKKKNAEYIEIYVSDREYYPHMETKKYDKNLYQDTKSKRWCKEDDPRAELKYKKGELMKDKNGQVRKERVMFKKRKTRRFSYKPEQIEFFNRWVKRIYLNALLDERVIHYGFSIKRYDLKDAKNTYQQRIITRSNIAMQSIEVMMIEVMYPYIRQKQVIRTKEMTFVNQKDWYKYSVPPELYKKVRAFYYKQSGRFKKGSFHDTNGKVRKLKDTRVDFVEESIQILLEETETELKDIVNEFKAFKDSHLNENDGGKEKT